MNLRIATPVLAVAVLAGGLFFTAPTPAEAKCLSQTECDSLKSQLMAFRDATKSIRDEAKDLRRQARDLPRGSEERRALRRRARELKKDFRQERRDSAIRDVARAYRSGCKNC